MSSVSSIASSGLQLQALRLAVSANNTANQLTAGFAPSRVEVASVRGGGVQGAERDAGLVPGSTTDAVGEAVARKTALSAYQANLATLRTADQMTATLLDTFA